MGGACHRHAFLLSYPCPCSLSMNDEVLVLKSRIFTFQIILFLQMQYPNTGMVFAAPYPFVQGNGMMPAMSMAPGVLFVSRNASVGSRWHMS